jgi:tetratricopeptide (TPR) repeat protein
MKRMYPQALAEYDKIADQDKAVGAENQFVASSLGWIYAVSGRRADALKIAKELKDLSSRTYVDFYPLGAIYAGLGDKDEAFPIARKRLRTAFRHHALARHRLLLVPDAIRSALRRPAATDGASEARLTHGWSEGIPG